jgi:DNA-binding transcriptional MerR regulator
MFPREPCTRGFARLVCSGSTMVKRGGSHQRVQGGADSSDGSGPTVIPDKLYFRIGDVAKLCQVPTYVLRFWQTEFPQLRPGKSGTGQRLYRKRDVEMALRIKRLLHEEGYTIAGAKTVLASETAVPSGLRLQPELPLPDAGDADRAKARLHQVRGELRELLPHRSDKPGHSD